MSDFDSSAGMIEPELLVATFGLEGEITSRNQAWTSVFGDATDVWDRLMSGDAETARQNLSEASRGSLVTHALFMVDRPDRDLPLPVLLHFVPVNMGGAQARGAVAVSGEILAEPSSWTESQTQRHRMETLGRMTMGMAHDFNNLLGGILGHVQLWKMEDSKNADEHVHTIEKAASDGAELISKIQRYIRQEAQSAFEPIDLTALVQDCISFTKPYWYNEPRRHGIDIKVVSTLGSMPLIEGSSASLRDVMVNLILNAVHALPDGGLIRFEGRQHDSTIEILVTDTGSGMTDEVQRRIFEPLYSTKGDRGTGMGLAVAAGVMREHGGSIQVKSTLGQGSTFTLSFPTLTTTQQQVSVPEERNKTVADTCSIVVVDDEEMVRNVLTRLLSVKGHSVRAAGSGKEALELLDQSVADIIITDQGMPEMNGRELARQCRKRYPNLPIILLTGDTDLNVDSALIDMVLTKPFKIDLIQEAISTLT